MRSKKNYSDVIYGLDIETSTINMGDEKCSFMYSFCIGKIDLSSGDYTNGELGRTYNDLDVALYKLNTQAQIIDKDIIIYCHFFSYEFSFFCNNLNFFKSEINNLNEKRYLFLEPNKPLYIKLKRLEFRCSYLLLNKSIANIGKSIGLNKLDYDYDKLRTPLSKLNKKEMMYNFRDVEIMLKGVYDLVKKNPYINNANDLPRTKTGVMRHNCEHNPEVNVKEEYVNRYGDKKKGSLSRLNKYLCGLEKANDLEQLEYWQALFQGGLVYSNPKLVGEVMTNVASYDLSSDYPFQMLVRFFPSNFKKFEGNKIEELKRLTKHFKPINYVERKPFYEMFNATIVISKMKAKYDFFPIGTSKVEEIEKLKNTFNCKIINGKIVEIVPKFRMLATCIDYLTLMTFYDFELEDVEYLEVATRYKRSNDFKINSVVYNGNKKIEYKKYHELVEKFGSYKNYNSAEIEDEEFRKMVNSETDYLAQCLMAHDLYQNVKSDLNAQYGDNAQHLLHDRFSYDTQTREYNKSKETFEEYLSAQHRTSYIYGLYVPQYARATILYLAHEFIINGLPVYYIDTDSIKTIDCEKAQKIVDEYNAITLSQLGKYKYLGFGQLEKEYVAEKFCSLGTKSYIKYENGNIKATVSGLPNATRLYTDLLDFYNGNFDEMIFNCYHYGVVIDKKISGKSAFTYKFIDFDLEIGNYKEHVVSGATSTPVDVTMRDFNAKTWHVYAQLICAMYNKDYDAFCFNTRITKNEKGVLQIKHEF